MRTHFTILLALLIAACASPAIVERPANLEKVRQDARYLLASKRYAEALPLMEILTQSGDQWATFMLANYHVCGRIVQFSCSKAEQLFTSALDSQNADESDTSITRLSKNEIAWINAACDQSGFRGNLAKARRLSLEAVDMEAGPYAVDTLAAVLARSGEFSRAVDAQRLAIRKLEELSRTAEIASYTFDEFKRRLSLYEQKKPASFSEATSKANCNALPE